MKKLSFEKTKKEDICCPHCEKKGTWTQDNPDRPFCSARCKLIDLGAWASEEHRIPGESTPSSDEDSQSQDK